MSRSLTIACLCPCLRAWTSQAPVDEADVAQIQQRSVTCSCDRPHTDTLIVPLFTTREVQLNG